MRPLASATLFTGLALIAATVLGGCKKLPPPTPLNQLNAQQTRGYYVFQTHCLQCHYDRVNQPLAGPTLRGVFKKDYLSNGEPANDDRVMSIIVFGYGTMPPMGSTMAPSDRDDLVAYLHSL